MNTLAPNSELHGFTLQLLQRTTDVALYEKRKDTHHAPSFEVVLIQKHPAETVRGREYPARESMPPSESWGTLGWTYTTLPDAQAKFTALVESPQEGRFQPVDNAYGAFSPAGGSVYPGGSQRASAAMAEGRDTKSKMAPCLSTTCKGDFQGADGPHLTPSKSANLASTKAA